MPPCAPDVASSRRGDQSAQAAKEASGTGRMALAKGCADNRSLLASKAARNCLGLRELPRISRYS